MLSVTGIYDGKSIFATEAITEHKKYKVIITFVEELDNAASEEIALRDFGSKKASLDFWNDSAEDIYQDYLDKSK